VSSVFISYRRADSGGYAGRIFDRLCEEFGPDRVFRDVDDIPGGTRFRDAIVDQLSTCKVVLVIIGPEWVDTRDENGRRRLENADDWVRTEVATALGHPHACVIPVTVGGASLPAAKDLPADLQGLVQLQLRDLRDGDTWDDDLHLLVRRVASELGGLTVRTKRVLVSIVALLLVLAGGGWYVRWSGGTMPAQAVTTSATQTVSTVDTAAMVVGTWNTGALTNPYDENEKFELIFESDKVGDKLVGTVRQGRATFGIFEGQIKGDVISFYTKSEVVEGDLIKPYKELYDGIVKGDRIQFRMQDDLSNGGIPMTFVATRLAATLPSAVTAPARPQ